MDHPALLSCPFPAIHTNGDLVDGLALAQSSQCHKKCQRHDCLSFEPPEPGATPALYTCPRGFSVAVAQIDDTVIRINGVIETSSNSSSPAFKRSQKHRKLKLPQLIEWLSRVEAIWTRHEEAIQLAARQSIHALHDIKSLISSIVITTDQWLWEHEGQSFDDKVEGSPPALRKIYQSSKLLQSLLQMTDVIVNPEVTRFGTPHAQKVYSVLFLLTKVHEDRAAKRNLTFIMKGRSFTQANLYGSFIILPYVIIDNAIKHATKGTGIHITIEDQDNAAIAVDISSQGNLVSANDRTRIFDKFVRGDNISAPGSGLGLWIGKVVAEANGIQLSYRAEPLGTSTTIGFNHFEFLVPRQAPDKTVALSRATT